MQTSSAGERLTFPFGQPIVPRVQQDRSPKRVFVLGVHGGAVQARWVDPSGTVLISALAVASEPEIFWRGEGADAIVDAIARALPHGAGRLEATGKNLNGPEGRSLDEDFLGPLGVRRSDAWLCDLLPESRQNAAQALALEREYLPRMEAWGLPAFDFPPLPAQLADTSRRAEIVMEIVRAEPDLLVTLGDMPLEWFAQHFGAKSKLSAYGQAPDTYGRLHEISIAGHTHHLLPLVHPRQAARLGAHSGHWASLHENWRARVAPSIFSGISMTR